VNRSKRGLALDLKKPNGSPLLMRLVRDADVFVHNFRPSVPKRLGIAFERCRPSSAPHLLCGHRLRRVGADEGQGRLRPVRQVMTGMAALQASAAARQKSSRIGRRLLRGKSVARRRVSSAL